MISYNKLLLLLLLQHILEASADEKVQSSRRGLLRMRLKWWHYPQQLGKL